MNRTLLLGIVSLALVSLAAPVFALGETTSQPRSTPASEQIHSRVNPQVCLFLPGIGWVCRP